MCLSRSGSIFFFFFFSSRRRHTRWTGDRSSDVCSSDLVLSIREAEVSPTGHIGVLQQIFTVIFLEPLHDFSYVLGALSRANQQCIRSLNYHEIVDADGCDKFGLAPEQIAPGVQCVSVAWQNIVTWI